MSDELKHRHSKKIILILLAILLLTSIVATTVSAQGLRGDYGDWSVSKIWSKIQNGLENEQFGNLVRSTIFFRLIIVIVVFMALKMSGKKMGMDEKLSGTIGFLFGLIGAWGIPRLLVEKTQFLVIDLVATGFILFIFIFVLFLILKVWPNFFDAPGGLGFIMRWGNAVLKIFVIIYLMQFASILNCLDKKGSYGDDGNFQSCDGDDLDPAELDDFRPTSQQSSSITTIPSIGEQDRMPSRTAAGRELTSYEITEVAL